DRSHAADPSQVTRGEPAERLPVALVAGGTPLSARPTAGVSTQPRWGRDATEAPSAGGATEDVPLAQGLGGDRTPRRERLPGAEGSASFRVRHSQPPWRGQRQLGGVLLSLGRCASSVPCGRRTPAWRRPQGCRALGEGFSPFGVTYEEDCHARFAGCAGILGQAKEERDGEMDPTDGGRLPLPQDTL